MKPLIVLATPFYIFRFIFTFSATQILTTWVGLEINLLSFTGILVLAKRGRLDSNSLKYFVRQALGSIILLISFLLILRLMPVKAGTLLFTTRLVLKLGLFPFHPWFISFLSNARRAELWGVSVPQKILPFWLTLTLPLHYRIFLVRALARVVVSLVRGVKTRRLSLVLGYSSLINRAWFLLLLRDLRLLGLLFFLYGLSLGGLAWEVKQNINHPQFSSRVKSQRYLKILTLIFMFINLGGLPPFFNIWNKFLLLTEIYLGGNLILLTLFIVRTGSFLYIYLNIRVWGASLWKGRKLSWAEAYSGFPLLFLLVFSLVPFYF